MKELFFRKRGFIFMMNKKIADLINEQINKELYSAYLYLAMANYYEEQGLKGFANYFAVQAKEEQDHAMYFRDYLTLRNAPVVLKGIAEPKAVYANLREPLVVTVTHEQEVTASIEGILEAAQKEKDYATVEFVQWYIREQAEEESNAENYLAEFDFIADDKAAVFSMDHQLAGREYHKSTPTLG
jgi:ferritin